MTTELRLESTQYQLLPALSDAEYEALKADIAEHGVQYPILVDETGAVLDGHHRLRICRELGISPPTEVRAGLTEDQKHDLALSLNLQRRHLSQIQRRDLIRAELERDPNRSNREIGRLIGVDHKTVAVVRRGGPFQDAAEEVVRSAAMRLELLDRFLGDREDNDADAFIFFSVEDLPPEALQVLTTAEERARVVRFVDGTVRLVVRLRHDIEIGIPEALGMRPERWLDRVLKHSGKRAKIADADRPTWRALDGCVRSATLAAELPPALRIGEDLGDRLVAAHRRSTTVKEVPAASA